ncbi:hypothetical protein T484DRAFT_1757887 [Baffinella frigidus]|nr:hypothetical protein T484DRAFT_1757887 [Cryptophyta sp. CCMP2293]
MVSTRADSSSRHMLQCRVHKNRLLSWTKSRFDNEELVNHRHKYSVSKDELVLDVGNPMSSGCNQYAKMCNPYPPMLSSFHGMDDMTNTVYACLMAHGSDFANYCTEIFQAIRDKNKFVLPLTEEDLKKRDFERGYDQVKCMPYFKTLGYSVGTAYAHERSGDTMASIMMGGINTCLNGAFPLQTGDRVMWDPTKAEAMMFLANGEHIKLADGVTRTGHWSEHNSTMKATISGTFPYLTLKNIETHVEKIRSVGKQDRDNQRNAVKAKQTFAKQQNGLELPGNGYKDEVALIKPFFYKNASDGDFERVFAVCLSPAAPFEMVDIMISRQSL